MKISLVEYKLQIRDYITQNSKKIINLKVVISLFPIFAGIYNNIYYKYQQQIIYTCLKKNLPGICLQPTKISWQTFEQIFLQQFNLPLQNTNVSNYNNLSCFINTKNQSFAKQNKINKANFNNEYSIQQVNFYNNFILVNLNSNLYKKQKKFYIGFFNNLNVLSNTINIEKTSQQFTKAFFNTFFYKQKLKNTIIGNNWTPVLAKNLEINNLFVTNKKYNKFKGKNTAFNFLQKAINHKKISLPTNQYLNTKLLKYQMYLNLDELPLKLNSNYIKNKNLQNNFCLPYTQLKNSQNVFQYTDKFFTTKNFLRNFLVSQYKVNNKLKKNTFLALKTPNFSNIFTIKNIFSKKTIILTKKNTNKNKKYSKSTILLQGVQNLCFFPIKKNYEVKYFLKMKKIKLNFFQNLIKIYSLNTNLTPVADYKLIHNELSNFQEKTNLLFKNSISEFSKTSKLKIDNNIPFYQNSLNLNTIIIDYIYNSEKSFELLKLLEHFVHINKNIKIPPRIMSGYFIPDISNSYNVFKLNALNSFLLHIKTSKNYLHLIDGTKLGCNVQKLWHEISHKENKTSIKNFSVKNYKPYFKFLFKPVDYIEKQKKTEEKYKHYIGPTIIQNKKTNELEIKHSLKIKKFIKQFLYSDNPLTDQQESFFGKNISYINKNYYKKNNTLIKNTRKKQTLNKFRKANFTKLDYKNNFFIKLPLFKKKKTKLFKIPLTKKNIINLKKYVNDNVSSYKTICLPIKIFSKKNACYVTYLNISDYTAFLNKVNILKQNLTLTFKLPIIPFSHISNFNYEIEKSAVNNYKILENLKPLNQFNCFAPTSFVTVIKKSKIFSNYQNFYGESCAEKFFFYPKVKPAYIQPTQTKIKLEFKETEKHLKKRKYSFFMVKFFPYFITSKIEKKPLIFSFPLKTKLKKNQVCFSFDDTFSKKIFYNYFVPIQTAVYMPKILKLSNRTLPFIWWPVNQLDLNKNLQLSFANFPVKKNFFLQVLEKPSVFPKQTVAENLNFLSNNYSNVVKNKNLSVNYMYFPYSQIFVKQPTSTKFLFGKTYKKNYSVYKNKSSKQLFNRQFIFGSQNYSFKLNKIKHFYQLNQPINNNSWLFLAQFSIGFFLISVFQNILQKYQQEMKYALLNSLENKTSNMSEINTNEINSNQNFKMIKTIVKNFDNIAGIDSFLPELGEIIWFLRNSSISFKSRNSIPQRILLTGPPGTGKTLLVQAIAGEAKVPILVESGSSLTQPEISTSNSEKLKNLFNKAREIAPCIVFIDEIDTFGQARNAMMENSVLNNSVLDSVYTKNKQLHVNQHVTNFFNQENLDSEIDNAVIPNKFFQNKSFSNQTSVKNEKSNLLLQFLVELDGISSDKKIVVFGATNRQQTLDLALTRPGRFNKILKLKLPNKQKRIEIIKLYTKNLGISLKQPVTPLFQQKVLFNKKYSPISQQQIQNKFSWEYLANLTVGLSAADLASAINQSSIKAIQIESIHTLETIEYGLESITGYTTQKNTLKKFTAQFQINNKTNFQRSFENLQSGAANFILAKKKSKIKFRWQTTFFQKNIVKNKTSPGLLWPKAKNFLFINRLAYYQAGKIVVHTLLKKHPAIISICLWPELRSSRYHLMNGIFEKNFSQLFQKVELESRIIGFYAGKAGEFLGAKQLQSFNANNSTLGNILLNTLKNKFNQSQNNAKFIERFVSQQMWVKNIIQLKIFFYGCQSDFGVQDISFANWLAQLMVNNWFLYCKKLSTQHFHLLKQNYNKKQILNIYTNGFLKQTSNQIENIFNIKKFNIHKNKQNWYIKLNFQKKIIQKFSTGQTTLEKKPISTNFVDSKKLYWYRIYVGDHKENENTKYVNSDIYYHNNIYLNNFKSTNLINVSLFKKPAHQTKKMHALPIFRNTNKTYFSFRKIWSKYYFQHLFWGFRKKNQSILYQPTVNSIQIDQSCARWPQAENTKNNLIVFSKKKHSKMDFLKNKLNNIYSNKLKNFNLHNLAPNTIIRWNDILQINHDYIYYNLILICFNKSISILNHNRELLDLFVSFLLQKEILREYQIKQIIKTFKKSF